ncbi:MAG: heme NO-binding domain-containing protein [Tateyamaria sp.]|uniref:heme NO-binding domain-containing protein n=1 Tax=Tateyamaria sp. TaxID=1929288 RepID=UPI00329B35F9
MHGLINRAIQCFVEDSYGSETWVEAAVNADLGFVEFESMLAYDDDVTPKLLDAVSHVLNRERNEVMEDIGTYLVSHPNVEALRRLLRFCGLDFVEFLHSLDDLPDRARLAVSDLNLPGLELRDLAPGQFRLACDRSIEGYGHVVMGVLRAMADDYGVLAVLEHAGSNNGTETISITLIETEFAEGRSFELGGRAI